MKNQQLFILFLFSLFLSSFSSPQKIVFKGRILFTSDYCNGKGSNQDIKAGLKPHSFAHKNLWIKRFEGGNLAENPVLVQVKTDEKGYFSLTLDKGKYGILTDRKIYVPDEYNMPSDISKEDCLKWANTFDLTFTVFKPSDSPFLFRFHQECSPCKSRW